jgi:hypothetical protein
MPCGDSWTEYEEFSEWMIQLWSHADTKDFQWKHLNHFNLSQHKKNVPTSVIHHTKYLLTFFYSKIFSLV